MPAKKTAACPICGHAKSLHSPVAGGCCHGHWAGSGDRCGCTSIYDDLPIATASISLLSRSSCAACHGLSQMRGVVCDCVSKYRADAEAAR